MKKGRSFDVKEVVLCFMFLFLISSFTSFISASCSLGATPTSATASVQPGGTVEVVWNFFNLYGDRATHFLINQTSGPNWDVTINPDAHVSYYNVSGIIVNETENVAVENSSVVLEIPANISEGMGYVRYPKGDGYIPVKPVKIDITVPNGTKLGETVQFIFQVKANCFMGPGAVIPAIATSLTVNITTANNEFYEKPVSSAVANGGTGTGFSILGLGTTTSILAIVAVLFVIGFFFLLVRGMMKSAKEKKKSSGGGNSSMPAVSIDNRPKPDNKGLSISFSS